MSKGLEESDGSPYFTTEKEVSTSVVETNVKNKKDVPLQFKLSPVG